MGSTDGKFLIYIIGGFVVAFIGLFLTLIIYNTTNPRLDYGDMTQVDSFVETLTQEEDVYLVYFYSESCPACQRIKNEVLSFSDKNNMDVPVYFVDLARVQLPDEINVYLTGYRGTPHMEIIVNNSYIGEYASGTDQIPNLFDEINSGENDYIQ